MAFFYLAIVLIFLIRNDFVVELSYHTKIRKETVTMDMLNFTPNHKKGQHLTREERYYISIRLNIDHWSIYKIAKELHRPYNTELPLP